MSSDFGLRGPKTSWVCPSDRQLALRAKLRTGWSLKTNQFNKYPKPQPLTEKEQQAIVSVIKRAEELELYEQQRVGKLVDRLESLRRLASGNGHSECVLCGDSFGLSVFGRSSYRCADCKKAVCRKCVVDLTTTVPNATPRPNTAGSSKNIAAGPSSSASASPKESIVRLCKLCAENREFIKKSGAWFYKGIPKYVLPEKRNNHYHRSHAHLSPVQSNYQEQRYVSKYISEAQVTNLSSEDSNKRSGGVFWSRSLSQRSQSEADFDSSSDDDAPSSHGHPHKSQSAKGTPTPVAKNSSNSNGHSLTASSRNKSQSSATLLKRYNSTELRSPRAQSEIPNATKPGDDETLYELLPLQPNEYNNSNSNTSVNESTTTNLSSSRLHNKSFERFIPHAPSSESSLSPSVPTLHQNDNNHLALSRSSDSSLEGAHSSSTSSSIFNPNSTTLNPVNHLHEQKSPNGTLEISLLYDDAHQALHCSIHRARDIIATDLRNSLSDPYCMLILVPAKYEGTNMRTKTVHKTLQPVFNETLTFYGMTQNDLARQSLQINVMDDDKWGRDCLGTTQISLHRLKQQQTRFFSLELDGASSSNWERTIVDKEWGRGRLLLSLFYSTEKNALIVGVVRAHDLPALDLNGTSDPYVKVRLVHDSTVGTANSVPTNCASLNKKYKTSVKWKTLNPEFLEEFSLKVSLVDLSKLALVVSVWDKDMGRNNDYIGGIYLSSSSKGERLKHWTDMMKICNKKQLRWHTLSPVLVPSS